MSELTEQNLTRQQAEQEMACLRKIYASVRLLDRRCWRKNPATRPGRMSIPAPAAWGARRWQANASAPSWKRLAAPSISHGPLCRGGRQALCEWR